MLYTLGQYIVNVQWSTTGDKFLTIFTFGICFGKNDIFKAYLTYDNFISNVSVKKIRLETVHWVKFHFIILHFHFKDYFWSFL